jgi:pyruvate kinase
MNVARFNFSHGDHEYHGAGMARVREASRLERFPVALLLDTKGPEIRTGLVAYDGKVCLVKGSMVRLLYAGDAEKMGGPDAAFMTADTVTVSYAGLVEDLKPGAKVLIADGLIALEVIGKDGRTAECRVLDGGEIGGRKNVNVVGVKTRLPALTEQDKADLAFGARMGVDFIAASFVRKASDVTAMQRYLAQLGSDIPVIAKIEDEEGLENVSEIIRVASGIMVARGDLGVQIPVERVPIEQKRIISLCNAAGKPVITATQMLDSMIKNPRPTRAEAGDVANAVMDGSDCVMLSGETANGSYPEEAVSVMDRIIKEVESSDAYRRGARDRILASQVAPIIDGVTEEPDLARIIAEAASWTADRIGAAAIVVPTISGTTARIVSRYRPLRRIVAASPDEVVRRRLLLHWGVVPIHVNREADSEAMIQGAIAATIRAGYAKNLDKVVVVAGLPLGTPLQTNSVRIHVIGNVLGRGGRGFGQRCTGRIVKARTLDDAVQSLKKGGGEILVTHTLDETFIPVLRIVDGVILEGVSEMPWEMIRDTNPSLVYVSQVPRAMELFEDRLTVTLDGKAKLVYEGAL